MASGTSFAYAKDGRTYLITNWHNVSGRNPETDRCLSDHGGVPNVMRIAYRRKSDGKIVEEMVPLYADAEHLRDPVWLEHKTHGKRVDVVALELNSSLSDKHYVFPINKIQFDSQFKNEVADNVFVVGYPLKDTMPGGLPIWKKASIASEPDLNLDGLPKMLIDTATRSRLSGSPAIMRRVGLHALGPDGQATGDTLIGEIKNFVGIYSGCILSKDELAAQLGIVWKAEVLDDIIP